MPSDRCEKKCFSQIFNQHTTKLRDGFIYGAGIYLLHISIANLTHISNHAYLSISKKDQFTWIHIISFKPYIYLDTRNWEIYVCDTLFIFADSLVPWSLLRSGLHWLLIYPRIHVSLCEPHHIIISARYIFSGFIPHPSLLLTQAKYWFAEFETNHIRAASLFFFFYIRRYRLHIRTNEHMSDLLS